MELAFGPSARITGPRRNGNHPTGTAIDPDPTRQTGETDEKKKFVADAGVLATLELLVNPTYPCRLGYSC